MIDIEKFMNRYECTSLAAAANDILEKEYSRYAEQHKSGMWMIEDYVTIAQAEAIIQALIDEDARIKENQLLRQGSKSDTDPIGSPNAEDTFGKLG